jgi:hypothetical protein
LYKQYEEKYTQLEDEEDNEPVAPERLMHKKCCDLDSSLSGKKGSNFYGMLISECKARKRQRLKSELKRFTKNPPTKAEQYIINPLAYWQSIKHIYPILYRITMDLFSIPAISFKYKHKFSSANNVIINDQNRLADKIIEALEFQKSWLNKRHIEKDKDK